MSEVERIRITGIAAGGAGVGRLADGRAVFVQRTAPGEEVRIRLLARKRRWARAELLEVLAASADRREAPCPHYERCGGCTLEHLVYGAQLRAKAEIVAQALRRIGGLQIETPEVVGSPAQLRYRNRVSFTLRRMGGRVVAGFHELNHAERLVDISSACLLPESAVAEAWGALRSSWGAGAARLPAGRELRLTLRASAAAAVSLLVEGGTTPGEPEQLLERVPGLVALWHQAADAKEPRLLAGVRAVPESWLEEEVGLGGSVFLQVNRAAAALLEEHVADRAGDVAGKRVVDAYCGVGLHARRLARAGARVVGLELDALAVEEARRAAPTGARFEVGRVEALLPAALPADVVIVNPPRAGLDPAVPAALLARPPERLLYVSCDPATLARDLERLGGRYAIRSLRCFDLFPQTAHVETVAELTCATS